MSGSDKELGRKIKPGEGQVFWERDITLVGVSGSDKNVL